MRTARKEHNCTKCGRIITKGETYTFYAYPVIRGGCPAFIPPDKICTTCKPQVKAPEQAVHCEA